MYGEEKPRAVTVVAGRPGEQTRPGKHHFMSVILMVCTCPLLVVNRQK